MLNKCSQKILFITSILTLLHPFHSLVYASNIYFDISFDRSVNIVQPDGKNKFSDIGDYITINKKGRLWLTGNETKDGFSEIVCQNLSEESVNVEFTNLESPWVSIGGKTSCKNWQKNILICAVGQIEKGIFCKSNERKIIPIEKGQKKQKFASVNIRSMALQDNEKISTDGKQYLQNRIAHYAAGIELCGLMFPKTDKVFINWIIYNGGTVDKVTVDSKTADADKNIADCIAEHISFWKFPEWKMDSEISYQF